MSVKVSSWVWEHSQSKGNDRLVLLAIADVAGDDGRAEAYARSVSHLAAKTQLSPSTVRARIGSLVELGELVVLERGDGRESAKYQVNMRVPDSGTLDPVGDVEGAGIRHPGCSPTGTQGAGQPAPHHPVPIPSSPEHHVGELELLSVEASPAATSFVDAVFSAWVEATGKNATATKLDKNRRAAITAALKTHPLADVLDAVRGWRWSAFHRGENERHRPYNGLHVLLRSAEQIELFRDLERAHAELGPEASAYDDPAPLVAARNGDPDCPHCDGTGHVFVDDTTVTACSCRRVA